MPLTSHLFDTFANILRLYLSDMDFLQDLIILPFDSSD